MNVLAGKRGLAAIAQAEIAYRRRSVRMAIPRKKYEIKAVHCAAAAEETYNVTRNNTEETMVNIKQRIEALKVKKQGLSFAENMESILSKEYADIWMDIDYTYVHQMVQEKINEKDSVVLYFNKQNEVKALASWEIRNCDNQYKDSKRVEGKYTISLEDGWTYTQINLDDIFVVTDFDAYIDYQLEQKETKSNAHIENLNNRINEAKKALDEEKAYHEDAKRFGLKSVAKSKIRKLRKAELIRDNKASLEELAELV